MQRDVAIIGGGPAGCAAALALRSRGHSVTVISARSQKAKPTETAAPALSGLLRSLGASEALDACEPCHGFVSGWGNRTPVFQPSILNPYGHAWFIHRARFDAVLRQAACNQGVEWLADEAHTLGYEQDAVSICTTGGSLRTRWAIIATGSPVYAARLTHQKATQFDSMIAFWAHLPASYQERLLHLEPADCGWWYLCPADGIGAIACFITDTATAKQFRPSEPANWSALFRETDLYNSLTSNGTATAVHVALTGLAALPNTHGSRWIAVGDAAAQLDPLGSSGTMTALDSAQRAARAVAQALQGDPSGLTAYNSWSGGLVKEFARQRRQQYVIETRRRSGDFWPRRDLFEYCSRITTTSMLEAGPRNPF